MAEKEGYVVLDPDRLTSSLTKPGNSVFATVANAVKSVLGAGVLTLSWAFYFSSLWPGVACTFVMCLLAAHGFYTIGLSSELTGERTYSGIWGKAFGAKWAWLPDLIVLLFCGLAVVSYLVVAGDYMPKGFEGVGVTWPLLLGRQSCILIASAVLLPLNFMEDLSFLSYTSILGTAGTLYTAGLLVAEGLQMGVCDEWQPLEVQPGLFVTVPSLAFAFNGHFSAPALYQELRDKSPATWLRTTAFTFGICLPLTLSCGISGYLMFGSDLGLAGRSNVLTAPALQGRPEVMVAYLATTLSVLLGIPIYANAVREAVDSLWLRDVAPALGRTPADGGGVSRRRKISAVVVVVTVAGALSVTSLGLMVALNGAVCACLLMFVFPSLMYLRVSAGDPEARWSRVAARVAAALGALVGVCGIATTLMLSLGMQSDLRW